MGHQIPESDVEDFDSSAVAADAYRAISAIKLDGVTLILRSFVSGVTSFQTRTKQWLRRVDIAPSGILLSTEVKKHTLPNGQVVTTTTGRRQVKDVEIVTVTTQNAATPSRTTVVETQTDKSGTQTKREISTTDEQGIKRTEEKKTVHTEPPDRDNVQPIKVVTLDGVTHYQWFGVENPDWAAGDQQGTTTTNRSEQIIPGQLNGQEVDSFGNPILVKVVDEDITHPDGRIEHVHTETAGIQQQAGTTVTDEQSTFSGSQVKTVRTVTHPDGSKTITDITTDVGTGDSVEVATQIETDEFGQVTTTVVTTRTTTVLDSDTGRYQTNVKKTTVVTRGGVTTTDVSETTRDSFDDDLLDSKVKVFLIQEFTISCIIDSDARAGLFEKNLKHQMNWAKIELLTQMLGNLDLSWDLRQTLMSQYDNAMANLNPMEMEALGNTYNVVFAPSASAFRSNLVVGVEPHIYELQMILQQRSDLSLGVKTF